MSLASHDAYMYALMHTAINGIPVNIMPVLTSIGWALDRSIKTSYKYNQILEKNKITNILKYNTLIYKVSTDQNTCKC